jgi:parallel beta-helix repeat protein
MGDITIHADSTLTIESSVKVEFQGLYSLTVNGYLEAVGTQTDSIHFSPGNAVTNWWGIFFTNAPDSSHLAFCRISHAGGVFFGYGGIICTNSNPVITHCQISDNQSHGESGYETYGGGIGLNNSNAAISWCNISNNKSGLFGGGINIYNSSPVITGCNISGNETLQQGGGIYITGNSSPMITNCTVEGNKSNMYGGGISAAGVEITISECTIGYNKSYDGGGGISISGGSVILDHCVIEANQCLAFSGQGGGLFASGGSITVDHCTFFGDYVNNWSYEGMEIHTRGNAAMTATNNIFYGECNLIVFGSTTPASVSFNDFQTTLTPYYFSGNVPAELGKLTNTNANGDSCDAQYNIFLNPLFVNMGNRYYHLQEISPCIDAGDPISLLDPDNTVADMGRYFFDQRLPVISLSDTLLDFGTVYTGNQGDLPLTIYNSGSDTLELYNLVTGSTVFTSNWDLSENLILPGDSLEITVYFTPNDAIPFTDTLQIENNHQLSTVLLTGKGEIPPMPEIALSDTIMDFGTIIIGQSEESTITLYNTGTDTLAIYSLFNDHAAFASDYNPEDSLILTGDSLSIAITFTPDDPVAYHDTLFIENNHRQVHVRLTGKGELPALPIISLSDTILDFGTVTVGQHSDLDFIIYNRGTGNLVIYTLSSHQEVFTTDYISADSLILPGDSLSVTITFTPQDVNAINDTLFITNNDQNLIIKLNGTGQPSTGIYDQSDPGPGGFSLLPAYPNPFNSSTTFVFDLPAQSFVIFTVYNILGEQVSTLLSKNLNAGRHRITWNPDDLPVGVYFYRLQAGQCDIIRKISFVR